MNFHEAESYLYSLGNEVETMKLGLDNILRLLSALGHPQNNYLKVQVAGTNGKGSVCAFLRSICLEAGINAGVYTSPHLISITERINIGGIDISEDNFARFATKVCDTSEQLASSGEIDGIPTFFEQVTAIALLAFAKAKVDVAILETGLGGRLDATTAAEAEIAAITRIDVDHQQYLGETLTEIAAEKAAIISSGSKAVVLHQSREAEQVIVGRCREVGVEPIWATSHIDIRKVDENGALPFYTFSFTTERDNYPRIQPHIVGRHQSENMSVAIAVSEMLNETGFNINNFAICIGMETARHPGRLEYVGDVILDGAHNVIGARALAAYFKELEPRPFTLIFGSMNDKNVSGMLCIIAPLARYIVLTKPSNPRALTVHELSAQLPRGLAIEHISAADTISDALNIAREITPEDGVILVTGSLYLVGEAKRILMESSEI